MKKAEHLELGARGEQLAAEYLEQKGYIILHRNWRNVHEEIDIIALEGNILLIVEVKTRSTDFFGEPEQAVTPAKQKKLAKAAEAFLEESQHKGEMRFDIISVTLKGKQPQIVQVKDAFYPFFAE